MFWTVCNPWWSGRFAASEAFPLQLWWHSGSLVACRFVLPLVLAPSVGVFVIPADVVCSLAGLSNVHPVIVLSYGRHLLPIQILFLLGILPDFFNWAVH